MRQHRARGRGERTSKCAAKGDVGLTIRHAKGEHPAGVEQVPRGQHRCARIGELFEGVPDGDCVESPPSNVIELADRYAKSHSTGEFGGALVDVEALERPPSVVRRAEEGTDVAPYLESWTSSTKRFLESSNLGAVGASLIRMQRTKGRLIRHLVGIGCDQLGGALARVAVNERAAPALRETKGRCLREGDAVRKGAGWCSRSQSSLMKLPQYLHLGARIVGVRDLARVARAADGAGGEVVGRQGR